MGLSLAPAVSGERKTVEGRAGRVSYYVRGQGAPVLLLHSINAAASAYEVRPIYERVLGRVYAPDLPGFGHSERSDRDYSPALYVAAIHDMLDVIANDSGDGPVEVVALSLTCEFLARASLQTPGRMARLVFITPTGFQKGASKLQGPECATRQFAGVLPVLSLPLLSDGLFSLLTTRASMRFFLQKTWGSKAIDEDMLDYCYHSAQLPGAKHAPLAFLSGKLFSADVRTMYEKLAHSIWMAHGTRGDFGDFSEAEWVRSRSNWRVRPFDTGALVHFERPTEFLDGLSAFREATVAQHVAQGCANAAPGR